MLVSERHATVQRKNAARKAAKDLKYFPGLQKGGEKKEIESHEGPCYPYCSHND